MSSQRKSFGFMAAPVYGQWICHSPNVMKTDIFASNKGGESGKSTQGSIRFDSLGLTRYRSTVLSRSASRYPAKYILRFAISLALAGYPSET